MASMKTFGALAVLVLVGCGGGVQSNPTTGGSGSGSGSSGATTSSSDPVLCGSSNPCPSGEFCFNGLCALGCNSDGDCSANQYCDTGATRLCQNKSVPSCSSNADCASDQVCHQGFCSTPPPSTQCQVTYDQNDGCEANSVCLNDPNDDQAPPKCYSFPACAQDGTCPTGTEGALCNDGYLAGKAKICLPDLCKDVGNCPTSWACIKANSNDVIGECSNGAFGSPCASNTDCVSHACNTFPGGGFCN